VELARRGPDTIADRGEFLNHRAELRPAAQGISEMRRRWEKPLTALMAMVVLVLLIACANVASLMLARASVRRKEIAIRLAIGAGRYALMRQLLAEGLLLALIGGALGLVVAAWTTDALIRLLPGSTGTWLTTEIDPRMLGFAMALSIASGLLFSLVPGLQAARADVADTLKNQANVIAAAGPARFRKAIVAAQVALSLLLVVGAGLFGSSLRCLMNVDLGFRTEQLLMFSMDATGSRHRLPEAVAFYKEFQERLASTGNVMGVGAADGGPFSGSNTGGNITVEGYRPKENEYVGSSMVALSPGFFHAMGFRCGLGASSPSAMAQARRKWWWSTKRS